MSLRGRPVILSANEGSGAGDRTPSHLAEIPLCPSFAKAT